MGPEALTGVLPKCTPAREGCDAATTPGAPVTQAAPQIRGKARTATNSSRGKEAVTAVIGKAYRPEVCARSTIYVWPYEAGFTVVIPAYRRLRAYRLGPISLPRQQRITTHIVRRETGVLRLQRRRAVLPSWLPGSVLRFAAPIRWELTSQGTPSSGGFGAQGKASFIDTAGGGLG